MAAENVGNRRSACDRCRRHKLRCERGDTARCWRCEKSNSDCLTGPALRSGRPQQHSDAESSQVSTANSHGEHSATSAETVADTNFLSSATPPEMMTSGPESALDQFISPTNLGNFSNFWSPGVENGIDVTTTPIFMPITPPSDDRNECLKKLGELQANIVADLETVKCCITADKCPEAINPIGSVTSQNLMIGRMLDYATSMIEILNRFQPCAKSSTFELTCDTPTMFVLLSSYVGLVRICRTILSCVLDCLPFLLGIQSPVPQLFPGMHLGGFKLEARVDLQVQILVQICENMLAKIESAFGLKGILFEPESELLTRGKAARILSIMLEEETNEQPPLYEPRGHCGSLKTILARLKDSV